MPLLLPALKEIMGNWTQYPDVNEQFVFSSQVQILLSEIAG